MKWLVKTSWQPGHLIFTTKGNVIVAAKQHARPGDVGEPVEPTTIDKGGCIGILPDGKPQLVVINGRLIARESTTRATPFIAPLPE